MKHGGGSEGCLRPRAVVEGWAILGRGESLSASERTRPCPHHAAVVVDRRDLAGLPGDQHDLPVVPEQDGVSQVAIRRELDTVDVAFGLARDALAETARRRPLRPRGGVANHLLNRFGEGH